MFICIFLILVLRFDGLGVGWGGVLYVGKRVEFILKKNCVGEEYNFLFIVEGLGLVCEYVYFLIWLYYRVRKLSDKIIEIG